MSIARDDVRCEVSREVFRSRTTRRIDRQELLVLRAGAGSRAPHLLDGIHVLGEVVNP